MSRSLASTPTATTTAAGYYLLSADGGIFAFGAAPFFGTANEAPCKGSWVALQRWPDGAGLVALASDGSIASIGGSGAEEDMVAPLSSAPAIDIAVLPRERGLWVLDAAGGVFTMGDAGFFGSVPGLGSSARTAPVVAMSATPTGMGYWILDRDGGIYCFGDAEDCGSVPRLSLDVPPAPAVDLVTSPTGAGYAVLESDGSIRTFDDTTQPASVVTDRAVAAVAFAATDSSGSYAVVDARGLVFPVRNAPMLGSTAHLELATPVVDVAVWLDPHSSAT